MTNFRDPIAWEDSLPIRPSSPAWRCVIRALYGTPLQSAELELFRRLSGGRDPSPEGAVEFLVVAGRRAGKSETIARLGVFEAIHGGHGRVLAPGQLGLVAVISPLREQSQEIMGYARGLAALAPLKRFVAGEPTRDEIRFSTGVALRVMTADSVAVAGPTVVCAIRDELAKFPGDDAATPDREIDNSLRPALAPVLGAPPRRLIGITSAYLKDGVAFETDRDHFGGAGSDVLVVRGATEEFNPAIDRAWLARERRRVGERVFAREYQAEWQDAIVDGYFAGFESCIRRGVERFEPEPWKHSYVAALDPAFRSDNFALAIGHREKEPGGPARTVLDLAMSWKPAPGAPLSAEFVMGEAAAVIAAYGATSHTFTDQFGFDPLREVAQRHGVFLQLEPWTAVSKPARFGRVRAGLVDRQIVLPDVPELHRELGSISTKLLRSGGEQIAARRGRDDLAHAAVLALSLAQDFAPDLGDAADSGILVIPSRYDDPARVYAHSPARVPPGATDVHVTGAGGVWYRDAHGDRMWIPPGG